MFGLNRFPISSVTPHTYRDGLTLLALIMAIRDNLKSLVEAFNRLVRHVKELDDIVETIGNEIDAKILAFEAEQDLKLRVWREELLAIIEETTAGGLAWNPTNGKIEVISKVLSDVYDNVRVHAYFTADLDALGLTVAQIEALNRSARHFDLSPIHSTNDELVIP